MSIDMIGGMVAGTCGGGLQLAQFLMGGGKKGLGLGPGLVGWFPSFPHLEIVIEHSSLEYQLICNSDALQRGVRGIPGRGVLRGAFDLINECLDRKVGVVQRSDFGVVVLQVGGRNFRVGSVRMVQDGAGGGSAVDHVAVAEVPDKHFLSIFQRALLIWSYSLKTEVAMSWA